MSNHSTYSFRAECSYDALRFLTNVCQDVLDNDRQVGQLVPQLPGLITFKQEMGYPDVNVEFSSGMPLEDLRNTARDIEDCHVIVETLRPVPLAQNSLERK